MAAGENLGASFSIDIGDLKAGLSEANRLIRQSESEFQAAAAGLDDWSSSADGLQKRVDSLTDQVEIQKKKVAALVREKQNIIDKMTAEGKSNEDIEKAVDGVNKSIQREGKQLERLKGNLVKNQKALDKVESANDDASDAMDDASDSADDFSDSAEDAESNADDLADSVDDAGDKFKGLKSAGKIAAGAVAAVAAAAAGAVTAFLGLAESTRETRTNMAKMETSFEAVGLSAEQASATYTEFYGVLGDEGQATEAVSLLANIADTEEEIAAWTDIATGAYAKFGDSLPTEGLIEAANETAKTGTVTGNLADALNWTTMSNEDWEKALGSNKKALNAFNKSVAKGESVEDAFNAALAECSTEQERQELITAALTGLYGESADAYRENNSAVIEAQKAQANLNTALANMGAIAEPIMTTLKQLVTDLLVSITPFVAMMGEGLQGAMNGTAGSAQILSDGLSGIFDTLLTTVTDMLPVVLELLATLVPQLITTLLEQIPTLLDFLLNEALPMLLDTLAEVLPQILTQIATLIPSIIDTLIQAIPTLLESATTFLMAIVDALPTIVTALVEAVPTLVQSLCDTLAEAIPTLFDAAIEFLMAIVDALPDIIDALIEALPTIMETLTGFLTDNLPTLFDAAVEFLLAIVDAIPDIVDALIEALPDIITTITDALVDALPDLFDAAIDLFGQLIEAIPDACESLLENIPQIIDTIVDGLGEGWDDLLDAGLNIVEGIWEGISSGTEWLWEKISGWVDDAVGWIGDLLGIASPSKVMADFVGKNMALGIGEGFEDTAGDVAKTLQRATDELIPDVGIDANVRANGLASGKNKARGGVVVYQTNNYAQAHTRYELYKSKQATEAAVRAAVGGAY